jgi:CO/xanthine dehydrogenase FAD-binding subunit
MIRTLTYYAPATIQETVTLLHQLGAEAKVLAGGQDLLPLMNQGKLMSGALVDLKALKHLVGIQAHDGVIRIGALTTHRGIAQSDVVQARCRLLADAAGQIGGGAQVRNRGTIGGAICAANPAYDFAPCLVALDAEVRLLSAAGERRLTAATFFQDANITALQPEELLTEITVPAFDSSTGFAYQKLKFTDGCYNIASAACAVQLNPDGTCRFVRLAVGGVAPVPIRLHEVEGMLSGRGLTETVLTAVSAAAERAVINPIADVMADGAYRRAMAGVMAKRTFAAASRRALERPDKAEGVQ